MTAIPAKPNPFGIRLGLIRVMENIYTFFIHTHTHTFWKINTLFIFIQKYIKVKSLIYIYKIKKNIYIKLKLSWPLQETKLAFITFLFPINVNRKLSSLSSPSKSCPKSEVGDAVFHKSKYFSRELLWKA